MEKNKKTVIVNIFGGPGAGKSSMAAGIYSQLKWKGIDSELSTEYAKDLVWSNSLEVLKDQLYVFAKQNHRLYRLKNKVDVIVTDAPILLSLVYGYGLKETFKALVKEQYNMYNNMNFLLEREKPYDSNGRLQTREGAIKLDNDIRTMLDYQRVIYESIRATEDNINFVVEKVIDELNETRDEKKNS